MTASPVAVSTFQHLRELAAASACSSSITLKTCPERCVGPPRANTTRLCTVCLPLTQRQRRPYRPCGPTRGSASTPRRAVHSFPSPSHARCRSTVSVPSCFVAWLARASAPAQLCVGVFGPLEPLPQPGKSSSSVYRKFALPAVSRTPIAKLTATMRAARPLRSARRADLLSPPVPAYWRRTRRPRFRGRE